jgi:hypothetical protein
VVLVECQSPIRYPPEDAGIQSERGRPALPFSAALIDGDIVGNLWPDVTQAPSPEVLFAAVARR